MVLFEQAQIDTLREKCDHAVKRIWVASPFIGGLKDIQKIIGGKWMLPSVDCKILTDIDAGFIRNDAFEEFKKYQAEIRTLFSLHSKIYIVDDWCLVTSANLTGTAFLCRYEMGVTLNEIKDVETTFLKWWDIAQPVYVLPKKKNKAMLDYQDGKQFPRKFKAPAYSSGQQDKYDAACEKYVDFANRYKSLTGRNPKMEKDGYTLLQEVDYLFNYLYRDHPNTPSRGINTPRALTSARMDKEILRYFHDMCSWYDEDPQEWRLERTKTIQTLLAPDKIDHLSWKDAESVVMCLHCLRSYPINQKKFLNPKNNSLKDIRECWKTLLHTGPINKDKIDKVTSTLHNLGISSVQELIGWYYPEKYPLINNTSNIGMCFFGYDVV